MISRVLANYCLAMLEGQCRALAIANESVEYERTRKMRSEMNDAIEDSEKPMVGQ